MHIHYSFLLLLWQQGPPLLTLSGCREHVERLIYRIMEIDSNFEIWILFNNALSENARQCSTLESWSMAPPSFSFWVEKYKDNISVDILIPCKPKINGPLNAGWRCFASLTSTWFFKARLPLRARCAQADKVLTWNHWGIAVLLLVAVLVGTEAFHEAQVALSQKLGRDRKRSDFSREREKPSRLL